MSARKQLGDLAIFLGEPIGNLDGCIMGIGAWHGLDSEGITGAFAKVS